MLAISSGIIPQLYPPAKWYYVFLAGVVSPPLAFANAYGAGVSTLQHHYALHSMPELGASRDARPRHAHPPHLPAVD